MEVKQEQGKEKGFMTIKLSIHFVHCPSLLQGKKRQQN